MNTITTNDIVNMNVKSLRAYCVEHAIAIESKMKRDAIVDAIVAYIVAHENDDDLMTIAQLSRENNINPKIARAKLRRRNIYAINNSHVQFRRNDETYARYLKIITTTNRRDDVNA